MREELINLLKKVRPDVNFDVENQLLSEEVLDSFDIMMILAEISDNYNVEIDPDDVNEMYFDSVEGIEKLINNSVVEKK